MLLSPLGLVFGWGEIPQQRLRHVFALHDRRLCLLDSVLPIPNARQAVSRRSISSGTVLSLSALVTIEVRDNSTHARPASLDDLCAALWTHCCVRRVPMGDDQSSVDSCLLHWYFTSECDDSYDQIR